MTLRSLRPALWVGLFVIGTIGFRQSIWAQPKMNAQDVCDEMKEMEAQMKTQMDSGDDTDREMLQMMQNQLNTIKQKCLLMGRNTAIDTPPPPLTPPGKKAPPATVEKYRLIGEESRKQDYVFPENGQEFHSLIVRQVDAVLEIRSNRVTVNGTGNLRYAQTKGVLIVHDGNGQVCEAHISAPQISHPAEISADRGTDTNTVDVYISDANANNVPETVDTNCGSGLVDTSMTSDSMVINNIPVKDGGHVQQVYQPDEHTNITVTGTLQRVP